MRCSAVLSARPSGPRSACRLLATAALAGLLAGCGMGAPIGESSEKSESPSTAAYAPTAFAIATESLPSGQPGVAYPTTAFAAVNAAGPVTWTLASGELPAGLLFGGAGVLRGTPQTIGFSTLTVRATSGTQSASRVYGLSVGVFGVVASRGLVEGRAWSGVPVTLTCAGATGS